MENKKVVSKKVVKSNKLNLPTSTQLKKANLINLSESIKSSTNQSKRENIEGIYIFTDSEMQKANDKLSFYQNKFKGISELTKNEKRKLSLKNHLSSTRSNIRNKFESRLIAFFKILEEEKLSNDEKKELAKLTFLDFFKNRFVKFKESEKIFSDMFCNNGNSLNKKIESLCNIWNK